MQQPAVDVTDAFWPFAQMVANERSYDAMTRHPSYMRLAAAMNCRSTIRADALVMWPNHAMPEELPRGVSLMGGYFVFCDINALLYGALELVRALGSPQAGRTVAVLEACLSKIARTVDVIDVQAQLESSSLG